MAEVKFGFSLTEAQAVSDGQGDGLDLWESSQNYKYERDRRVFHLCQSVCLGYSVVYMFDVCWKKKVKKKNKLTAHKSFQKEALCLSVFSSFTSAGSQVHL